MKKDTNMEVENHLFVVDFMVFLTGPFSTSMLVLGSVLFQQIIFFGESGGATTPANTHSCEERGKGQWIVC